MRIIPKQLALAAYLITSWYIDLAAANVEKTIFVAPSPQPVPAESSVIDDLGLERLSPGDYILRTNLNASFPTHSQPYGTESWLYLEDLNPGQRYEVRICWLATQPTSFTLTTYSLADTISDPTLISALTKFSEIRLADPVAAPLISTTSSQVESVLFLRIQSAADYFTTDSVLMENVPPVTAYIILDPFILNVFPRSLVPTAIYAVTVAILVYFIGKYLGNTLSVTAATASGHLDGSKKNQKQK
ncbi:hypothetical protein BGW36DRAFT_387723 [Talaromyces proteolyticus]|uniref:Uncharacterized protein n=1 Tax=Talaromyces proteolyticus TaxID=1131652 RepID=A0AAD4KK36_9EURO|nr:uncharacterized protein BGW36DRAFT_387723 [Talaromyces proteolyticus]KAH8691126.1 hypothetical protein BGW36DRAFT_387723 [Talaromyces proteolyticus]